MTSDRPVNTDPDPGRRLMIAALIGAALLALAVIAAMGYFVWQRVSADPETAYEPGRYLTAIASDCQTSG